MKKPTFYLLLILIFASACRKDINELETDIDEDSPIVLVQTSIRGKVVDEAGLPVSNASIRVAGNFTTSNENGNFQFNKIRVKKIGGIIRANTAGYFEGISHSNYTAEGSSFVQIQLMEKEAPNMIIPASEQVISKPNGLKITIPANSIVTTNGTEYNGEVNVYSRWIDPTDENLGGIMPGALNATDADGEERVLATYGMVVLEMETPAGTQLEVRSNRTLKVEIPIPAELVNEAPLDIPLWEYDLGEEQWLENGICNKEGSAYVCNIPSTGFWNCDVPLEAICLSGQVFNADSTFASYLKVIVEDLTDNFIYWGYTDSLGIFCGSVPRGAPLRITILDHCDNIVYTAEIGPFSEDFQLDDIYLNVNVAEFLINVIGAIEHCDNTNASVGHLSVRYPGTLKIYPFFGDNYDVDIALKCTDFPTIELTTYSTLEDGSTITTSVDVEEDVDLGLQNTCESLIDSFGLIVDGVNYFTSPTQYYLKPNQTTDWMVLEGLSAAGNFTIELRNYQGVGEYTSNVFFRTGNTGLAPDFDIFDAASPDITVNVTLDDGVFIVGNYFGIALDINSNSRNISGDFKIRKAP